MSEEQYFAASQEHETELERLRVLERLYDPVTIRHLETLGVSQGWNCLEVGAGAGSLAQWLSTRVAPTGKVVATDTDTEFLSLLSISNLEIRRHDILKDDLEANHYDLVHCRCLLEHLPEPEKALKRMADALHPGGWLLIEDSDAGSMLSADITNPAAADLIAMLRASFDWVRKMGIWDTYFGRRVRTLIEGLKFIDVGQEGWTCTSRGSDPISRFVMMTLKVGEKYMIAAGVITQEQFDGAMRVLSDPDFYTPSSTLFAAWCRRPFDRS
jgi:SAM-dependent methyltransferase